MKSKNKKAKLISISLLALCFSMLAFGVYALKNATLTVQGTVGFKAHDCMVTVSATIAGDGVVTSQVNEQTVYTPNADGTPSDTRQFFGAQQIGRNGVTSATLTAPTNIPVIYFTDLTPTGDVEQIVITFSVTNDSFYDISATITSGLDSEVVEDGIAVATKQIAPNATQTLVITYDLNKVNGDYQDFVTALPYSINLTFAKYVAPAQQANVSLGDVLEVDNITNYTQLKAWMTENIPGAVLTNDNEQVNLVYQYVTPQNLTEALSIKVFATSQEASSYYNEFYLSYNGFMLRNNFVYKLSIVKPSATDGTLKTWLTSGLNAITESALGNLAQSQFENVQNTILVYSETTRRVNFSAGTSYRELDEGIMIYLPESTQDETTIIFIFESTTDADNFYADRTSYYTNLDEPGLYYSDYEVIKVNDYVVAVLCTGDYDLEEEYNEKIIEIKLEMAGEWSFIVANLYVNNEIVGTINQNGATLKYLTNNLSDFENAYIEISGDQVDISAMSIECNYGDNEVTLNNSKHYITVDQAGEYYIWIDG